MFYTGKIGEEKYCQEIRPEPPVTRSRSKQELDDVASDLAGVLRILVAFERESSCQLPRSSSLEGGEGYDDVDHPTIPIRVSQ